MNREDYNFDPMTGEKIIKDDYNFDPMTGEKIVKTNEQSQQFNSEGYQPNNKIAIIVIVVVTVIFLAVASGFVGYFLVSGHNQGQKPANPILTSEAIKWSAVKLNDGEIPNTYENNMPSAEIKGVGTKSSIINKLRENTDKSLGSLQVSEIDGGVKYYTLEDQVPENRYSVRCKRILSIIEFIILIMMYCILDLSIRRQIKTICILSRRNVQIYK